MNDTEFRVSVSRAMTTALARLFMLPPPTKNASFSVGAMICTKGDGTFEHAMQRSAVSSCDLLLAVIERTADRGLSQNLALIATTGNATQAFPVDPVLISPNEPPLLVAKGCSKAWRLVDGRLQLTEMPTPAQIDAGLAAAIAALPRLLNADPTEAAQFAVKVDGRDGSKTASR